LKPERTWIARADDSLIGYFEQMSMRGGNANVAKVTPGRTDHRLGQPSQQIKAAPGFALNLMAHGRRRVSEIEFAAPGVKPEECSAFPDE
jgi:hypothetical protein